MTIATALAVPPMPAEPLLVFVAATDEERRRPPDVVVSADNGTSVGLGGRGKLATGCPYAKNNTHNLYHKAE